MFSLVLFEKKYISIDVQRLLHSLHNLPGFLFSLCFSLILLYFLFLLIISLHFLHPYPSSFFLTLFFSFRLLLAICFPLLAFILLPLPYSRLLSQSPPIRLPPFLVTLPSYPPQCTIVYVSLRLNSAQIFSILHAKTNKQARWLRLWFLVCGNSSSLGTINPEIDPAKTVSCGNTIFIILAGV